MVPYVSNLFSKVQVLKTRTPLKEVMKLKCWLTANRCLKPLLLSCKQKLELLEELQVYDSRKMPGHFPQLGPTLLLLELVCPGKSTEHFHLGMNSWN